MRIHSCCKMSTRFIELLLLVIGIVGCTDNGNDNSPTANTSGSVITKCGDYERITVGEYIIDNNVWAKGNITNYQQCIWANQGSTPLRGGWNWSWPSIGNSMKAMPQIHYGWTWWEPVSFTTTKLPIKVGNIRDIYAYYNTTVSATGLYNTTFDLWLTSASVPTRNNRTREIMIWVDTNTPNDASFIKRVSINGEEYDLHVNYDWNVWT